MKLLKRWLAFFVVVVLIIGVAFNSRGPLRASHIGEENITTNETGEPDTQTADEGQQQTDDSTGENKETEEPVPPTEGNVEQPQNPEETPEEKPAETPEEPQVHQDAMELSQVMTGENGELICNVIANIPEGTFEANTADVTMEVTYVAADVAEQIKSLMNKALSEGKVLGEYFLYNVVFKVNGEQVEPGKEIKITFEQNNFQIKDTKKANTFYYNEANSVAGNAQAEIIEIIQKSDKIEELQNAGQSIDNIDDHDLSEISLKADGLADKVMMEGRRSTIYGCYVEEDKPAEPTVEEPKTEDTTKEKPAAEETETVQYEDDEVTITVSADKKGIIPEDTKLQVVPIRSDDKETKEQYKKVEDELNKKAEGEEYDIAGFLAYDISFVNAEGEEVEPNGEVKVTIDYKSEVIPEDVEESSGLDVTVMHLEENKKGAVKEVVDMVADETKEAEVETTDNAKVTKVELKTDSFSIYTITWTVYTRYSRTVNFHYVDADTGDGIDGKSDKVDLDGNDTIDLTDSDYQVKIDGYKHKITTIDKYDNDITVTSIKRAGNAFYYNGYYSWSVNSTKSYNVYFVYEKISSGGSSADTLGTPNHNKYIKYNEATEDYTLTLDVTGKKGEKPGADVLLVLDRTGSMGSGSNSLMTRLKNTINGARNGYKGVVDQLIPDNTSTNSISAVSFNTQPQKTDDIFTPWVGFDNKEKLKEAVKGLSSDGGTNWEYAMFLAENNLTQRYDDNNESSNEKYVIFISDGQPNRRGISNNMTADNQTAINAAISQVNKSTYLKQAKIFSVYLTNNTRSGMQTFANGLDNATLIDGINMETALEDVVSQIAPVYKNVTIEDTLSEYVDFTDTPNFKVTSKKGSETKELIKDKDYTLTVKNKKVSVELLNGGELEDGVTYSLSFNVKTTQEAKDKYLNGGYLHVGEEGTDAPGNNTSAGKDGFFSNSEAIVKYQENDNELEQANYKKPVVQVISPKCDFSFMKVNTSDSPVAGAKFLLVNDKDSSIKYETSSDLTGRVEFKDLKEGTYTLTETEAAAGYVKENSEWKVKVEKSGKDKVEAKLYTSGGELVEDNKIVNYTEHEEAVKYLTSDKTAKVIDEANRIFQIDLTASTSGREEGTEAQGASIVLVLDASNSMGENGMKAIKDAATSFITKAKDSSPISEVGVIFYQGTEGENPTITSTGTFHSLNNDFNTLYDFINDSNKTHSGGTPMGAALETAKNLLNNQSQYSNKYVLFFTDGAPGYWKEENGNYYKRLNCMVANHAFNEASSIKENATIYTIGYNLYDSFSWNKGHSPTSSDSDKHEGGHESISASSFLENHIASESKNGKVYSYDTKNIDQLGTIFDEIAGSIGELFKVHPEKIVDVIDARFELTKESKAKLESNPDITIKENEDGTTTITWTGDSAIIGNKDSEDPASNGWSASIQVKAKDDFIGGNMVPTNGASSGIYVDGTTTKPFPQPSVNVKLLDLDMEDKEITVYKGDTIDPSTFADELAKTLSIVELDNKTTTDTGKPSFPVLTDEQKSALQKNQTIILGEDKSIEYIYPNTEDAVGYFVYTYKLSENPGGDMKSHAVNEDGKRIEVYELEVQFIPYTIAERNAMTELNGINTPAENGGTELNPTKDKLVANGEFVVNAIAGEIRITKLLDKESSRDQNFTFKITKDGEEYKTVTITIPAGETEASYEEDELKKLPRGVYEVAEVLPNGYSVKAFVIGDITNCESSLSAESDSVIFKLGNNTAGEDVITQKDYENGILGQTIYTNEEVYNDWDIQKVSASDDNLVLSGAEFKLVSDTNTYYGKSDSNGIVKWYTDEEFMTALEGKMVAGIYTLTETKSPIGYAVSTESWTLEITRNGDLKSIKSGDEEVQGNMIQDDTTVYFKFENTPVYDLPSAGGSGIYWYTVGGTLLMCLAGLLTLYKNKRKRGTELLK